MTTESTEHTEGVEFREQHVLTVSDRAYAAAERLAVQLELAQPGMVFGGALTLMVLVCRMHEEGAEVMVLRGPGFEFTANIADLVSGKAITVVRDTGEGRG